VQIIRNTIDFHLKTLFKGKEDSYNKHAATGYFQKLLLLAANEFKLHELHNDVTEDGDTIATHMRMVSLTCTYNMHDSTQYLQSKFMLEKLKSGGDAATVFALAN
jgi:hypothetical protein